MWFGGWSDLFFLLLAVALLTWVFRVEVKDLPRRDKWVAAGWALLVLCLYFIARLAWGAIVANIFNWL